MKFALYDEDYKMMDQGQLQYKVVFEVVRLLAEMKNILKENQLSKIDFKEYLIQNLGNRELSLPPNEENFQILLEEAEQ